ncbi:MBL fold metallo-hydrolase [Tenacibaculum sp. IB213877]|uniref:MBL fold metallo-hydrolase n=1 Tax=Tenacibaculum sp. IB213877 TaxID=3097351 RepID=UPI002A5989DE|nr:MBL fold metallo-hydrolase [Tenacibaculum sp. IB213877]MDY0781487.1 MBL fold metallo-hydrolase [Tenacibaculum sp. IB213877]
MKNFKKVMCLFLLLSTHLYSQEKKPQIESVKVTDNIYMLKGAGGNIGVFVGEHEVFMIDDKFAHLTPEILAAIKSITLKPVKYLMNTHWHGDHVGGNENMYKEGAIIVSHENVRKRMSVESLVRGKVKLPSPKEALPIITFTNDMMFHLGDEDILVYHVHNAHTDGDSHIYFTNSNVLHMGDTYFQGKFPYIDLDSGGSIDGYIAAVDKALHIIDDETIIIPGHMDLSNKKELLTFKNMLVDLRDKVQREINKGKSLEEVKNNTTITQKYVADYDWSFISAEKIRVAIYKSLKNK